MTIVIIGTHFSMPHKIGTWGPFPSVRRAQDWAQQNLHYKGYAWTVAVMLHPQNVSSKPCERKDNANPKH